MFIEKQLYGDIQRVMPILCVDVLVRYEGKYLLIKRTEEPVKDVFWVIGGRVNKGEDLRTAALRKIREEIGLVPFEMEMIGMYEDTYEESSLGMIEGGYHTVAVVFEAFVGSLDNLKLDNTSAEWGLFCNPPSRFKVKGFYNDDQN
jgi:colanic acid biosynthesis protein WcaH